jgi:hypothetical protein
MGNWVVPSTELSFGVTNKSMSNDIAQLNLAEPGQTDWDNYGKSGWIAPPPAKDAAGNFIVYTGVAKKIEVEEQYPDRDDKEQTYLTVRLDDFQIADPGKYQGYEIKFSKVSRRPYTYLKDGERLPKKGNPSKLGDYLRAVGSAGKPQNNSEYLATAKAAAGRKFSFTIDWEARNKDTGEKVSGYNAFPDDPNNPGQKKAILKAGDIVNEVDAKGNPTGQVKTVTSDTLFANARLRFFVDPAPKVAK